MSLDGDAALLKNLPIFADFGPDQLRLIAFGAETVSLPAKTILFREGADADGGYVLLEGSLLLRSDDNGKENVIDAQGTLIGELAMLAEVKRPATAASITDVRLMFLSRRLLLRVLEEYPAMAEMLKMTLSERLAELSTDLKRLHPRFATQ